MHACEFELKQAAIIYDVHVVVYSSDDMVFHINEPPVHLTASCTTVHLRHKIITRSDDLSGGIGHYDLLVTTADATDAVQLSDDEDAGVRTRATRNDTWTLWGDSDWLAIIQVREAVPIMRHSIDATECATFPVRTADLAPVSEAQLLAGFRRC